MAQPEQMQALMLTQDGYASQRSGTRLEALEPYVQFSTVPVPAPEEGQVLIKVRMASINPSDVMFIKGMYGQPRKKGQPAGFEGVGEVVAAGNGAEGLLAKRVAFAAGRSGWGSWADYAVADGGACIPVIDGICDEDAAAFIVNPLTALAMFDIVRQEGQKSFILSAAASQLGKLMIGVAREEGFRPIAIVRRDDQIEPLMQTGAAHVLNSTASDFASKLTVIVREEAPLIFLDAVTGPVAGAVFTAMPKNARWIVYGRLDENATTIPEPGQFIFMHKRIEGFWLTDWMRKTPAERKLAVIAEAQKRFSDGRWATEVTAVVKLSEAIKRVPEELDKPNGKVFIAPG